VIAQLLTENEKEGEAARRPPAGAAAVARDGAVYAKMGALVERIVDATPSRHPDRAADDASPEPYGVPTYVDKSSAGRYVFEAGRKADAIKPAITITRKSCSRASKILQLSPSP
jgi:hypothetical protein